ncbi:GntR family transcriptional regulator [Alicyclobacillus sp.]|uniref:FadR/GntR family transcriptional regulator n=1 Tax=Alicyclobacillus sp. TaxID=61169 RepID=UPI0025C278D2|nr:GntR family transcriptional regulator [Alicyclobacillus sp.]MCL6517114.1 GntR family transcriptional regulator [Alicyclobacillus sp.]
MARRLRPSADNRTSAPKLYARIADFIRAEIEQGRLRPGDRLPPLADLAERFQCSRATVREALGTLRGQGLVEFRHGDGTFVRTVSVDTWMEPLDAAILLSLSDARQLVELLTAVLAAASVSAAERAGDEGLGALAQALFRIECAPPDEEAVAAELAFHLCLARCAENVLLENVVRVLQEGLRSVIRLAIRSFGPSIAHCRAMYDAIAAHDPGLARERAYAYGQALRESLERTRSAPADGAP